MNTSPSTAERAGDVGCIDDAGSGGPSVHVRLTREFIDAELQLDQLLALTHGIASAGGPALQLVLPAVAPVVRPNWLALTGLAVPARLVERVGERLERSLRETPWAGRAIEDALESVALAFDVSVQDVNALVSVLVLGERTPLPVARLLAVMGQERTLARLRMATRDFKAMQMVG